MQITRFFQHYRNKQIYYKTGIVHLAGSAEKHVLYRQCYRTDKFPFGTSWVRPLKEWTQIVDEQRRFAPVPEEQAFAIISKQN